MKNEKELAKKELNEMFSERSKKVIEVGQGSWIITKEPAIIGTSSLSSCIGILAYDFDHKFAFLSRTFSPNKKP